jgi:hypothetical protein
MTTFKSSYRIITVLATILIAASTAIAQTATPVTITSTSIFTNGVSHPIIRGPDLAMGAQYAEVIRGQYIRLHLGVVSHQTTDLDFNPDGAISLSLAKQPWNR